MPVLGEPHLEAQDFQHEIGLLKQLLTVSGVFRPDEDFQQVVQVPFDAFAQHKTVVAGEFARVIARPQNQIVSLRDDDQLFMTFTICHIWLLYIEQVYKSEFQNRPLRGEVKE
jgi:hypothetical protein